MNEYRPDYAVPPGWILKERLEVRGISHVEFARRCGCSPELIAGIIAGNAPLSPATARQFERVLGLDASIWLGIESAYRHHLARDAGPDDAATEAPATLIDTLKTLAPLDEELPVIRDKHPEPVDL